MNIHKILPFAGAFIAVVAVLLSIIGVATNYWFYTDFKTHSGLWQDCIGGICTGINGGKPAALAISALIAMGVAVILAIFSILARNKSDSTNNLARICGILSVIILFSSGIIIAISLYTYIGVKYATGYSFVLMIVAQFLSFLAAMFVAHWMGYAFTRIH